MPPSDRGIQKSRQNLPMQYREELELPFVMQFNKLAITMYGEQQGQFVGIAQG
jgi:hypothetical protein